MQIVQNILRIAKEHNLNNQQLCKLLNTNPNKIYDWKIGKSRPSAQDICIIADYLGISADILLGRNIEIRNLNVNSDNNNRISANGLADIIVRYSHKNPLNTDKLDCIFNLYEQIVDGKKTPHETNLALTQLENLLELDAYTLWRVQEPNQNIINPESLPIAARDGGILSHSLTSEEIRQAEENTPELPPRKEPPTFDL